MTHGPSGIGRDGKAGSGALRAFGKAPGERGKQAEPSELMADSIGARVGRWQAVYGDTAKPAKLRKIVRKNCRAGPARPRPGAAADRFARTCRREEADGVAGPASHGPAGGPANGRAPGGCAAVPGVGSGSAATERNGVLVRSRIDGAATRAGGPGAKAP